MASNLKNCPRFNLRWADKVEAWNICSLYQDQLLLLSDFLEILVAPLNALSKEEELSGLAFLWTKTKIQDLGDLVEPFLLVYTCSEDIKVIHSFIYLGSVVHHSGLSNHEVNTQIFLAAGAVNSLDKSIWTRL